MSLTFVAGFEGFSRFLPTHQGRASERILVETLIGAGHSAGAGLLVPNNFHFDTTAANIARSGAKPIDLLCAEGKQFSRVSPFKGNMDVDALDALLTEQVCSGSESHTHRPILVSLLTPFPDAVS